MRDQRTQSLMDGLPTEDETEERDASIRADQELYQMVRELRAEMDEMKRKVKNLEYLVPA